MAYRLHYRGTLNYSEGNYQKAVGYFRRAYGLAPDNFSFALSLAVSLSRVGKGDESLKVLHEGERYLLVHDPEYPQKLAMKTFLEGMIYCYSGQYKSAVPLFKKSIELQEDLGKPKLISVFHNALGYATIMDQGQNAHRRADLGNHSHVHRRDLERALKEFEMAIQNNPTNANARHNFQVISDTLDINLPPAFDSITETRLAAEKELTNLPDNIFRALNFEHYDEVLFLLDISGSMVMEKVICMGNTRFQVMRETALSLLHDVPAETLVGIGTIGGDCGTTPRLWYPVGDLTRKALRQELEFLVPDGTTPLLNILQASPALFSKNTESKKSIFLVSDGANICRADGQDICEWAETLSRQNITINILSFLDANLNNVNAFAEYTCLADKTNGDIVYLDNLRCKLQPFDFNLVESCQLEVPELSRVECWGKNVDLWAVFD
ncbi:MAG: hypothetical protein DHS20C18_07750 [Saprospiraceae bacterium]|nr:MAG: hypothetical protein DHS20C18_07750 [Saprospiraceae bacterium]